ncbi:MAG: BCD family MFS transporter [Pseudomonadota bacterium]
MRTKTGGHLGWFGVFRLGLVQTALGAIVILCTSTLNRVIAVELALPAALPGALVGWHYAVQLSRPRWGHGADIGGARAPWIIGGMATLALGAIGAALSTVLMASATGWGVAAAILAFFLIGVGVGASGTNLLALLAARVAPARKAAAAAIVWIMMIVGFIATAGVAGSLLDPFSLGRLVAVTIGVCAIAVALATIAVLGVERRAAAPARPATDAPRPSFRDSLAETWADPQARLFTIFVFVAMLAYSAQDLILEPFAGLIHGYTPGESTKLAGVQNGGVLIGMIATAVLGTVIGRSRAAFMRAWTAWSCIASAAALGVLSFGALVGAAFPLKPAVFALGLANGAFAVAAIGSMMTLASAGGPAKEGVRMGLWGAAQASAFGLGGFLGAAALDIARIALAETGPAFALVFAAEGAAFVAAAFLSLAVGAGRADAAVPMMPADAIPAE